jgi:hypothetical protein
LFSEPAVAVAKMLINNNVLNKKFFMAKYSKKVYSIIMVII